MKFSVLVLAIVLADCGSPPPGGIGGDSDTVAPTPRCVLNADCPQNSTPFCVEGVCLQLPVVSTCAPGGDCKAGFHCSPDSLCLGGCKVNADCCPDGVDCACPAGIGCNDYECVSNGRCRKISAVPDCAPCVSMGWDCLATAPECYLADMCSLPSDCAGGQICVDNRCSACTANEQCPLAQFCSNGVCGSTQPSSDVNALCAADMDCAHVSGGYCSVDLNPRRCTVKCNNSGNCHSKGFQSCNSNGECEGKI